MRPIKDIIIIGSSIEAWLAAAMLRMRMPGADYNISVIESHNNPINPKAEILARPSSIGLHHILQLSEADLGQYAQARPALCAEIHGHSPKPILLPFGQYGIGRDGAEFQHLWKRYQEINTANGHNCAPLADYNLAITMHKASIFTPTAPSGLPHYDYGYILNEIGYVTLLKTRAANVQHICADHIKVNIDQGQIMTIDVDHQSLKADLYIDATSEKMLRTKIDAHDAAWSGNCIEIIGSYSDIDRQTGIRLHRLQSAIERLISLWPNNEFAHCEIDEYNRLTHAEQKHIYDMNALLLSGLSPGQAAANKSAALLRKISVFQARGRIAVEDYEIFSKAEWIAALLSTGISPQSYDRMALRMDEATLERWMTQLRDMVDKMIIQGKRSWARSGTGTSAGSRMGSGAESSAAQSHDKPSGQSAGPSSAAHNLGNI